MKVTLKEMRPDVWRLRIETKVAGDRHFSYETVHGDRLAAEVRRRELLKEADAGAWTAPDKVKVGAFFLAWVEGKRAKGDIGETTAALYTAQINSHIIPALGDVRVQAVTGRDIERLYIDLLKKVGQNTVSGIHGALLAPAFRYARKQKLIACNPMEEVDAPRKKKTDPKSLDPKALGRLLDAIVGHEHEDFIVTALGTGMRRGELCALRWRDVALAEGTITVNGQIVVIKVKGQDTVLKHKAPKTAAGRRVVHLPSEVCDKLRTRFAAAREEAMAEGAAARLPDRYVFGGDKHLSPPAMTSVVSRLAAKYGIALPDGRMFSPHAARHTYATTMLREVGREGAKAVSQGLGHAGVDITLKTYQTVFEEDRKRLGEVASNVFKRKKEG